jgi:hypothetical protein
MEVQTILFQLWCQMLLLYSSDSENLWRKENRFGRLKKMHNGEIYETQCYLKTEHYKGVALYFIVYIKILWLLKSVLTAYLRNIVPCFFPGHT